MLGVVRSLWLRKAKWPSPLLRRARAAPARRAVRRVSANTEFILEKQKFAPSLTVPVLLNIVKRRLCLELVPLTRINTLAGTCCRMIVLLSDLAALRVLKEGHDDWRCLTARHWTHLEKLV